MNNLHTFKTLQYTKALLQQGLVGWLSFHFSSVRFISFEASVMRHIYDFVKLISGGAEQQHGCWFVCYYLFCGENHKKCF